MVHLTPSETAQLNDNVIGFITEEGGITLLGKSMLDFLKEEFVTKIEKIKIPDSCFDDCIVNTSRNR